MFLRFICILLAFHPRHVKASKLDFSSPASSWKQEYFGRASGVNFLESSSTALVRTDNEFLLMNLQDGNIMWRRESASADLCVSEAVDRVFSASGTSLEGWAISSGQLIWRSSIGAITCLCSGNKVIFACALSHVRAYSAEDGTELWGFLLPAPIQRHVIMCSVSAEQLTVYARNNQQAPHLLHVVVLDTSSGQMLRQADMVAPTPLSNVMVQTSNMLVALSSDFSQACSFALSHSKGVDCADLPENVRQAAQQATPTLIQGDSDVVSLTVEPYGQTKSFLLITASNLQMTGLQQAVTAVSAPFQLGPSCVVMALARTPGYLFRACLVDCTTGLHKSACHEIGQHSPDATGHLSNASTVWVHPHAVQGDLVPRFVVLFEDDTLVLVEDGNLVWSRDEALAHVDGILLSHQSYSCPGPERRSTQTSWLPRSWTVMLNEVEEHTATGRKTVGYGLCKMILAVTHSGHIYALDSSTGAKLWSREYPHSDWHLATFLELYPDADGYGSQVLILRTSAEMSVAYILDTATGAHVASHALPGALTHVHQLPVTDFGSALLLARIAPPFQQEISAYVISSCRGVAHVADLNIWAADAESGGAAGYRITSNVRSCESLAQVKMQRSWQLSLPGKLLAVQPRRLQQSFEAHVLVHLDRTMRLRYSNPNSAVVVSASSGQDTHDQGSLITLLDTVSGRILHTQCMTGISTAAHAAIVKNEVLVVFWDQQLFWTHGVILDIFDHSEPVPSTMALLIGTLQGTLKVSRVASSYDPLVLEVNKQEFVAGWKAQSLLPTRTRLGVSTTRTLALTSSNQVVTIDASQVDQRRQRLQYPGVQQAKLGHLPQLNHPAPTYSTQGIRVTGSYRFASEPSLLESTIHLVIWGRDMYYSVMRPSSRFDALSEDFSFLLLAISLSCTCAFLLVTKHLVTVGRVDAAWK